jgi:GT2 family glycosyltransferase/glycosyltransferase involved in cell wall biosynthesis
MAVKQNNYWYEVKSPEVSIIVLNFNKADLTRECLNHIITNTTGRKFEIVIVDNGSDSAEAQKLSGLDTEFKLVMLPVNRYFGEGNNIGVEASRGKYLVFLNNDAFVTPNWLEPLIAVLENQLAAGGVGPKLLYPDGRVQEAGGFVKSDGAVIQRGMNYSMGIEELEKIAIVDYCSAACFATTREVFDRVSGFDATYEPAYYEDVDLCLKISSLNRFIYYCPQSAIYHIGNATTSSFKQRLGLENITETNRSKFLSRWSCYLSMREQDMAASLEPLPVTRRRAHVSPSSGRPIAVFYTSGDMIPCGAERYLFAAASVLNETHQVYIATEARYSQYRLDYMARELSLDLSGASMIEHSGVSDLPALDVFFHLDDFRSPAPRALGRRNYFVCQFPFPSSCFEFAERWTNFSGYDYAFVFSNFACDVLSARLNAFHVNAKIEAVPPPVVTDLPPIEGGVVNSDRVVILNIGRFFAGGANKRQDILIDALRRLIANGVTAELHLVGALRSQPEHIWHFSELRRKARGLPIEFHVNASPAVIRDCLSRATICWHATGFGIDQQTEPERCEQFGTGVVEAMAAGCIPFVVANGGPSEYVREGETGFLYTSVGELVDKTLMLLRDPQSAVVISEAARRRAECFSEATFKVNWRKFLA